MSKKRYRLAVFLLITSPSLATTFSPYQFQRGSLSGHIGGFAQADAAYFRDNSTDLNSGTNIRRARLYLKGSYTPCWHYKFMYDFADGGNINDAYISFSGFNQQRFTLGQHKPLYNEEYNHSATKTTFIERSLPTTAFSPGFLLGAQYQLYNETFNLAVSISTPGTKSTPQGSDPVTSLARLAYAPWHKNNNVFYMAVGNWWQRTDDSATINFNSIPEARSRTAIQLVNTGTISHTRYFNVANAEAGISYKHFMGQASFFYDHVSRNKNNTNLDFNGYFVQVGYFLTGEHELYNKKLAILSGISTIKNHRYGAWEIATRYSHLDLTSKDIHGGRENNITIGLNWHPIQPLRFMLNYIHASVRPTFANIDDSVNIVLARAQFKC